MCAHCSLQSRDESILCAEGEDAKEFRELKQERAELKEQLAAGGDKGVPYRIAIHQRISAIDNQITPLLQMMLKQSAHQSPSPSSAQAMDALSKRVKAAHPLSVVPTVSLADLVSSAVTDPPTAGKEGELQKWLVGVAAKLDPKKTVHVLAATLNPPESLHVRGQSLKPDALIYENRGNRAEGCAVAAIQLKKPGERLTPDDPTLQLFNYLHAIMYQQPTRRFCFGLLLNGLNIVLYRATRERGIIEDVVQWSGSFAEGQAFLAWLLTAPLVELGYSPPKITVGAAQHTLTAFIGSGQNCVAYELRCGDAVIVVKQYTEEKMAENERAICHLLRDVAGVTKLHTDQPQEKNFVAVTPRGHHFDCEHPVREVHVQCLCNALEALHNKGKVHGDICAVNIYWVDDGRALLNDWSHTSEVSDVGRLRDFRALMRAVADVGGNDDVEHMIIPLLAAVNSERVAKKKRHE